MPLKPPILPPLPHLLQKHPPAPLRERILTDGRCALDGAFRVRQRRGRGESKAALWFLLCRRVGVLAVHEIGLLLLRAVVGRGRGRATGVGAAGREWRGNLGQELEGLVVVIRGLLLLVVEWRGEHCSCVAVVVKNAMR
jgi:hypothetical protein